MSAPPAYSAKPNDNEKHPYPENNFQPPPVPYAPEFPLNHPPQNPAYFTAPNMENPQFNNYGNQPNQFYNYQPPPPIPYPAYTNNLNPPFQQPQNPAMISAPITIQTKPKLTSSPEVVYCETCKCDVMSQIAVESGALTWILCTLIFCLGGFFGCCLIPFCCTSCQDVKHVCPLCKRTLGRHSCFDK